MLTNGRPTRGSGALEGLLADLRAHKADSLIPASYRSGRILDIGCGSFPTFLAKTNFAEKWGVDQLIETDTRIELAGGHAHLLRHDASSGASLPFETETFSVVTMLAVFEHISRDSLVPLLRDVHRVLATGGLFIMTTPAHWTGWVLTTMARLKLVSRLEILEHKGSYDHRYILHTLAAAGFERNRMRSGTFEVFANNWVTAAK